MYVYSIVIMHVVIEFTALSGGKMFLIMIVLACMHIQHAQKTNSCFRPFNRTTQFISFLFMNRLLIIKDSIVFCLTSIRSQLEVCAHFSSV